MRLRMSTEQWRSLARFLNSDYAKRVERFGHRYSTQQFAEDLGLARSTLLRFMDENREPLEAMDLDIFFKLYDVYGDKLISALRGERDEAKREEGGEE